MILVSACDQKNRNNVSEPFTYLGPVDMVTYESNRPIKIGVALAVSVAGGDV